MTLNFINLYKLCQDILIYAISISKIIILSIILLEHGDVGKNFNAFHKNEFSIACVNGIISTRG